MSFSMTPSDTIRKHPTNNSTSKEVHLFSKTPRFMSPNPEYLSHYSGARMLFTPMIVSFQPERLPSAMATRQILLDHSL